MTNELGHRTYDVTNLSPAAVLKERADRPVVRRRRFTEEEKRHFLDLAGQPESSFSDVAQRYDFALSLLFRWRKEFGEGPAPFAGFTPVDITDDTLTRRSTLSSDWLSADMPAAAPRAGCGTRTECHGAIAYECKITIAFVCNVT